MKDLMIDKMNTDREAEAAAAEVKCKINDWGCVYHACMSEHCQKDEVLKYTKHLGKGKCE